MPYFEALTDLQKAYRLKLLMAFEEISLDELVSIGVIDHIFLAICHQCNGTCHVDNGAAFEEQCDTCGQRAVISGLVLAGILTLGQNQEV